MEHQINESQFPAVKAKEIQHVLTDNHEVFEVYIEKLLWWNKRLNLVSRNVSRETVAKHVEHSLVVSQLSSFKKAHHIIDTGTGGGLPGIPLAVLFQDKKFLLNDIVGKKILACKNIVQQLSLKNVDAVSKSIQNVSFSSGSLIMSKHAFKINDLLGYLSGKPWSEILLLKGRDEVVSELTGVDESLNINILSLEEAFEDEFYQGKAVVEIKRGK